MKSDAERYDLVNAAHSAVSKAIRQEQLKPPSDCQCADCGDPAAEYDHRDYRQPLNVVPVCRHCNRKRGPGQPYKPRPRFNAKNSGGKFFMARVPDGVSRRIEEYCTHHRVSKSDLIRRMLDGVFQHEAPLPW